MAEGSHRGRSSTLVVVEDAVADDDAGVEDEAVVEAKGADGVERDGFEDARDVEGAVDTVPARS